MFSLAPATVLLARFLGSKPRRHMQKPPSILHESPCRSAVVQVIVVNYEDRKTTMEAPNDEDDSLK